MGQAKWLSLGGAPPPPLTPCCINSEEFRVRTKKIHLPTLQEPNLRPSQRLRNRGKKNTSYPSLALSQRLRYKEVKGGGTLPLGLRYRGSKAITEITLQGVKGGGVLPLL